MKTLRGMCVLALLFIAVIPCLATEHAFMAFDVATQKMYAVVVSDAPIYAEISYSQENPFGYIGNPEMFVPAPVEVWSEAPLSPIDPRRLDIPDGEENVIVATINVYDAAHENLLQTLVVRDTLVSDVGGPEAIYDYRQGECQPVLPDSIRVNSSFCAFICHASYTIPIVCESPDYTPALLEISVSNGCSPLETHCNDANCPRLGWSEFRWFKRVMSGCRLYLTMTYCNAAPGCVCIWRSDFFLPVEMIPGSFRAAAGNGRVALAWATASETGSNNFVVTRSETRDGVYMGVHSEAAAGGATRHNYSWTDTEVENGKTYYYKLNVIDAAGNHVYNENGSSVVVTATPDVNPMPTSYTLSNYPNPFNSQTTFGFTLPEAGTVTLKIHDLLGRDVATVVDGYKPAGAYEVNWSAASLSAGVYMYTLKSGNFTQTQKLLFLK